MNERAYCIFTADGNLVESYVHADVAIAAYAAMDDENGDYGLCVFDGAGTPVVVLIDARSVKA